MISARAEGTLTRKTAELEGKYHPAIPQRSWLLDLQVDLAIADHGFTGSLTNSVAHAACSHIADTTGVSPLAGGTWQKD
jgi:hypothetical protein